MNLIAMIAAAAITPFASAEEAPGWNGAAAPAAISAATISAAGPDEPEKPKEEPKPEEDAARATDDADAAATESDGDRNATSEGADNAGRDLAAPPVELVRGDDAYVPAADDDGVGAGERAARAPEPRDPAADKETAAEVFDYIESLGTMRGRFVQIDPYGGVAEGAFYLRRPGRIRFDYDPPNPNLIVADGSWVIVQDRDLETTDRIPIGQTPLKYLLRSEVERDDLEILAVEREAGALALSLASTDSETEGVLTLVFSEPQLELRQWSVTDPQGQITTIALRDVVKGIRIDSRLFDLDGEF